MNSDSEPVLLVRVFDPVEAEIIVAKLRGAGITAYARHEALGVVYGLTVDGCGQQDIIVRASDIHDARAVMEAPDVPDGTDGGDADGAGPDDEE